MTTNNAANTYIVPTAANEVTMPSQPAFLSYLGSADNNVTGNGASHTLGSGNALTEVFDQNADFNTNGTFTAPVTGRYKLNGSIRSTGWVSSTNANFQIITSNRTYFPVAPNPVASASSVSGWVDNISIFADMDAADTATFVIQGTGEAGDIVDLPAAESYTNYSGYLAV